MVFFLLGSVNEMIVIHDYYLFVPVEGKEVDPIRCHHFLKKSCSGAIVHCFPTVFFGLRDRHGSPTRENCFGFHEALFPIRYSYWKKSWLIATDCFHFPTSWSQQISPSHHFAEIWSPSRHLFVLMVTDWLHFPIRSTLYCSSRHLFWMTYCLIGSDHRLHYPSRLTFHWRRSSGHPNQQPQVSPRQLMLTIHLLLVCFRSIHHFWALEIPNHFQPTLLSSAMAKDSLPCCPSRLYFHLFRCSGHPNR